ncbi:hypothetical protein LOTGIDRAFT_165222 [Lottia gigantea]|uniref:Uncharacterized protein n=1 Tax=Lottia gigantea TaxID=225164 RepID=V3ZWM8_LOTGI|nr:hypothetical protein LOTGIDRAFT_165222 [Lottia gigantea]ESO88807.1 hypothetical protein LOTGIDRAFT_165222 [Lottia gigantea]
MAESIEDKDGYLIPGVGLNIEFLHKIQESGRNPCGTNSNISACEESSLKQINSTEVQSSVKNDRQLNNRYNGFLPRCQNANEPEFIKSSQGSVRTTHQIADSSAWSVDTVTVKSGKHRTNRVSGVNKDRIKGMELPDLVANIHNLIAKRIISSHYRQTQPTRHSYGISCSNSTPGRRTTGPYRLKPLVNNKFQKKASYVCRSSIFVVKRT